MELKKGQILYVLTYKPIIAVNVYEVTSKNINIFSRCLNEYLYEITPVIEYCKPNMCPIGFLSKFIWIEKTLNLNKLIKYKLSNIFISINEKLIIKRFNILLKYQQKLNESKIE